MSTRTTSKPAAKRAAPSKPSRPAKPVQPKPRKPAAAVEPAAIGSKQSRLISLLRSPAGCTISDMMQLTGWQAHTVRGVISGVLRKKLGLQVSCAESGDVRRYQIVGG